VITLLEDLLFVIMMALFGYCFLKLFTSDWPTWRLLGDK